MSQTITDFTATIFVNPVSFRRVCRRYTLLVRLSKPSCIGRLILILWLTVCALFFKENIFGRKTWKLPSLLFPHVDFSKPSLVDLFRFIIQFAWLLIVKQQHVNKLTLAKIKRFFHVIAIGVKRVFALPIECYSNFLSYCEVRNQHLDDEQKQLTRETGFLFKLPLFIAVISLSLLCLTVPLDWKTQAIFVVLLWLVAMLTRKAQGQLSLFLLVMLSLTASCRYIWWRYTSTINWDNSVDLTLGMILLLAETYSWLILLLGYFQNVWPLKRKPIALPDDIEDWPTIDLLIPTYNEDLEVVKTTVLSALGVDWPKKKLNIYILDDGKRDSFKAYAEEIGVHYIRRPTNEHAKAGNLNFALAHTKGEFVAIFDCDHVPTRAFFQISMGAFLKDDKLALVQTPHHFFSPDPFERNLANFGQVPNEGHLFYGLIQDGNDLWDSTFFCGSCAVLRRTALDKIGGIAVETVTEDAHTFLKIHRLGYRSAYLRRPISAGLATESLSAHIGQRIRWARGMAQIFRIDNPLKGKGLKWHQRLCYLNAMLHFLSGIPRLIFLVAPLAFLLFHSYIIYAPALAIVLYVIPHMLHANIANSRIQGQYRHSFWGEIYETVLAWYIALPTTVALFAPDKGSFNVTEKGGLIDKSYFDWNISKPYLILVLLNIIGVCFGVYRIGWGPDDEIATTAINLVWTFYNLLLLGGALAVAAEVKQVRKHHRIEIDIPAIIRLETGHLYPATVKNYSLTGMRVQATEYLRLKEGDCIQVIMKTSSDEACFDARVVHHGSDLGLKLEPMPASKQIQYVQCTFAKADNWFKWEQKYKVDKPLHSLKEVFVVSLSGYKSLIVNEHFVSKAFFRLVKRIWDYILLIKPRFVASGEF